MGLLAAAIAVVLALPAAAPAATFKVTTTDDHDDKTCDADCTIREALIAAGSADTVDVPRGVYVLGLGELLVVNDHIVGAGARATFIDGANGTRVVRAGDGSSSIAGVTIRNGNGKSAVSDGFGGGVFVQSGATLTLTNSTVTGNNASGGGGIAAAGAVGLAGSTVSGNQASTGRLTRGGGIFATSTLVLFNSTISGNTAVDTGGGASSQGGGVFAGSALSVNNATIAGNTAATGGGIYTATPQAGTQTLVNTIVGSNTGGSCDGPGLATDSTHNNIGFDATCLFAGSADRQSLDPQVADLANNGGGTNTHALAPTSPAVNQGAGCLTTDQRGVTRPQPTGGICDIGAYEYRAPTLTVVTNVINDAQGSLTAGNVNVHVRQGGADVEGSPAPGAATGRTYGLVAGSSYTVDADPVTGYTVSYSADCAVKLAEGDVRTCTVTENDTAPVKSPLPPPVPGKNVNALHTSGIVKVKVPGSDAFVVLEQDAQLPLGTVVDVRKGRVTLIAGEDQTAIFYGGTFKIGQTKGANPITVLKLVEKLSCKQAQTAATRKRKRRLWGDGKGRFRTKGKHSAATVVGTKWLVEDRCTSTLTKVVRGKVSVRDFGKRKTVIVKAGKKYVARARR